MSGNEKERASAWLGFLAGAALIAVVVIAYMAWSGRTERRASSPGLSVDLPLPILPQDGPSIPRAPLPAPK